MSRESFKRSTFVDRNAISGETIVSVDIPKLLRRQAESPMHFILHGAFCGSTLLARYLEELPHCLVLKEPAVLAQLSGLRNNTFAAGVPDSWNDWFRVALVLLARGYPMDDAVIVKAPDLCSWMGDLLLDHNASTKVVFLLARLKVFLLHVFKEKWQRQWLRGHVQHLSRPMTQCRFFRRQRRPI